ncbi:alpha/beta fold hydrolase [Streptomyces sp. TG1A-8]|uniref:thioesterase II family protein n=1 Tax=Streptomyces sp. TG1A-8 TaxID=3051385 RepID=UPI00265BBCEE|nr:alpha/beta fold hydrolase [Streptomyces sp. TG1A-8]MDO0924260.1 alpha/beta fold hydrolase [Streptomyces sp. TG1A-8]
MSAAGSARRARWFVTSDAAPDAPYQVFLFPHAGGTAPMYQAWAATLPSTMHVHTLQLPGRQERLGEEPFKDVAPLLDALQEAFEAELDGRPYLLFGHSFGGLLAYRLAVAAESSGLPVPALLAVSGWAPALESAKELEGVAEMSDDGLLARVRQLGLMPDDAALDPATLATIMPALRSDFLVAGGYQDDGAPAPCPVAAYCGTADPIVSPGDMAGWSALSQDFLGVTEFPGGHFYFFEHAAAVQHGLQRHLRRLAAHM